MEWLLRNVTLLRLTSQGAQALKTTTDALVAVWAQNSPSATWDKTPIQGVYRDGDHAVYQAAFSRYVESPRRRYFRDRFEPVPPVNRAARGWRGLLGQTVKVPMPEVANGNRYLGKLGSSKFLGQ